MFIHAQLSLTRFGLAQQHSPYATVFSDRFLLFDMGGSIAGAAMFAMALASRFVGRYSEGAFFEGDQSA